MKASVKTIVDSRKQAVSIRMSRSDIRQVKHLADRLGARDSDVIRYAIKLMLSKLAPLHDTAVRGRGLVPVFLDSGAELMRHFEIDAARLSGIINEGVDEGGRVDAEDIQLIAMSGVQRSYVKLRVASFRHARNGDNGSHDASRPHDSGLNGSNGLNGANGSNGTNGFGGINGNGHGHGNSHGTGYGNATDMSDDESMDDSLRQYLYEKYLFARAPARQAEKGEPR